MKYRELGRARAGLPGMVFGLIIVGVGVIMLLQNLDLIDSRALWRYWPLALIAVGLAKIASACGPGGRLWGGMLAIAGALFLLDNLGRLPHDAENFIWPLLIIGFGLHMLFRALARRRGQDVPIEATRRLAEWAVFGGSKRQINASDFEGGECLAIFGGVEIDLRKAAMQKSGVTIDANAMFGGVELKVPPEWSVTVKGVGIFGGYEDKTTPPAEGAHEQHLIVTGYAIFGGVTVQN